MLLIDDLLLAPFAGLTFILRALRRAAEEAWTDDAPLKEQLLQLQAQLDKGEIGEAEYTEAEAAILQALGEIRRRKLALADRRRSESRG